MPSIEGIRTRLRNDICIPLTAHVRGKKVEKSRLYHHIQ